MLFLLVAILSACEPSDVEDTAPVPSSMEEVVCADGVNQVPALEGYPLLMQCIESEEWSGCLPLEWTEIEDGILDFRGCEVGWTVRIWRVR